MELAPEPKKDEPEPVAKVNEMVRIPGGSFMMGSKNSDQKDEKPRRVRFTLVRHGLGIGNGVPLAFESFLFHGKPVDLDTAWPVYGGSHLEVSEGMLTVKDGSGNVYRVDYTGKIPVFTLNH